MVLSVQDLNKSFGDKKVLQGVSFSAEGGRALGLLGRNGAGKTTSIRIIMGVFPPDSGSVLLDGAPIQRERVSIGYLPEEHGLYPKVEILRQLVYLAELRGMKRDAARQAAQHWLKRLGMEEYAGRRLETLSKGNQQKIQLVACLTHSPELVILDEPFSGLDPVNAALLKDVVKELIQEGRTVLFSSHQMSYVEEFCDSIAILHEGKIVLNGRITDIKRSYERNVLEIKGGQANEIRSFCEGMRDVVEQVKRRGETLYVRMHEVSGKLPLMERLAQRGFDIDSIAVYEPSLNDIFVQYTGDSMNDGEKEAGK